MSKAINAAYAQLSDDDAVTALVGANIEPGLAKQTSTYPLITLEEDGIEYGGTHGGSDGTAVSTLKIDCEATTYTSAAAIAQAVANSLNFQKGTWGGVVVQGCFVDDETEDYEYEDNEHIYFGVTVKATLTFNL